MEFSPSAKPSSASLDSTLNALLNLNVLQAALSQAVPVQQQPTPISTVGSVLLNSVLTNQLCLPVNQPLCTPFRSMDLVQEGLLPRLPLLYPYNSC
jgi:hypothetical protein